jgi:amino acid adenylation domain-containing protein
MPAELPLPFDRPRPAVASYRGGTVRVEIGAELHGRLVDLAASAGVTLFMVVQAGFAGLLTRLGAGTDIPVGSSIAGRTDAALDELVGFFVNTLVLRTDTSGNPTFRELLSRVRETDLAAYAHQDVPFEQVVERLNPPRSAAAHPLFQVSVEVNNEAFVSESRMGPLRVVAGSVELHTAKFDLTFSAYEHHRGPDRTPGGMTGLLEYSADLFDAETVRLLGQRLLGLFEAVTAAPDSRIGEVDLWLPGERDRLLVDYNDTGRAHPPAVAVPELFDRQLPRVADRVAMSWGGQSWTYAQLDWWANQVAADLLAGGVGPGAVVGVLTGRSPALVAATLGVLKAGAAYLPLTGGRPAGQIRMIMQECSATCLLTDAAHHDSPASQTQAAHGIQVIPVCDPPDQPPHRPHPHPQIHPEQLAYIMYTSGSTGRPKGVAVTHRNVVELIRDTCWQPEHHQRVLLHSAYGFDASTFELWLPLLSGTQIVIAPGDQTDTHQLAQVIEEEHVTSAYFTTGLFNLMADEHPTTLALLHEVWTSGDVASPTAIQRVLDHCPHTTLIHGYGPTETTVWCSYQRLTPPERKLHHLHLGRPMTNTQLYLLDHHLHPVPPGGTGELYIAGTHLARGYIANPTQTATRFLPNPFQPGTRMYRTGDLARWTTHHTLQFTGRTDHQTGKADQVAGSDPTGRTHRPPRTPQEEVLCTIFAEVLGLPEVGVDDDFFELGGNSLLAVRLIWQSRSVLGASLGIGDLFQAPTVAKLANDLGVEGPRRALEPVLPLRAAGARSPVFCLHPGGGTAWSYSGLLRYINRDFPVYGIQARGLAGPADLPATLDDMADDSLDRIRTVQPAGPYFLLGWSLGGVVAHAVAQRLEEQGDEVALLAILDGYPVADRDANYTLTERDVLAMAFDQPDVLLELPTEKRVTPGEVLAMLRAQGSAFGSLDQDALERVMRVAANNWRIIGSFTPGQFGGRATLYQAGRSELARQQPPQRRPSTAAPAEIAATAACAKKAALWTPYVTGPLDTRVFDCRHSEMLSRQALKELGPAIAAELDVRWAAAANPAVSRYREAGRR